MSVRQARICILTECVIYYLFGQRDLSVIPNRKDPDGMIEKFTLPYPAYTGEEERTVYVYLPDDFEENEKLRVALTKKM